ncbi:iron-sulfur cluster biosynthesis family protein [Paenibacillus sp. YN15]|uniref:iron-sulfur cluster biosynthesis family protein n=1 Tax=Paenibacillus sp. YN15 TaxID=1742774 RepID=UPI0015EB77B4|nr:iron-sulfur cluster biosynthesis family protein [Paenibacillus sp. YN15]
MNLRITETAVSCLKQEWGFTDGDYIRVYVRYASGGSEAYALGILREKPENNDQIIQMSSGGFFIYMKQSDLWFLEERNLTIDAKGEDLLFLIE